MNGLPLELQYLWVKYDPVGDNGSCKTLDFTWEREWRIRIAPPGALKLDVRSTWHEGKNAIIVERNEDVLCVVQKLHELAKSGESWPQLFGSIISLKNAKLRMQSQPEYRRIETWPEPDWMGTPLGE